MAMYFFAFYLLGAAQGTLITGWVSDTVAAQLSAEGSTMTLELAKALGLHRTHLMKLMKALKIS